MFAMWMETNLVLNQMKSLNFQKSQIGMLMNPKEPLLDPHPSFYQIK
jgi:hypothetical protein